MPRLLCCWTVCWLIACIFITQPALAQIDSGEQGRSRWQEHAYGMSLTAPPDAAWIEQVDDGASIKFITQERATISVFIRQSQNELILDAVKTKATNEFSFAYPSAVTMVQDQQPITVAERKSLGLFLLVPDEKQGNWVFGQVYVQIDPKTIAVYQLECNADVFDSSFKTFQTMLNSVTFADPAELDRERTERINNAKTWLDSINKDKIKGALIAEQWLRITQNGKDVGYMRIRQHDEAEHVPPGTSVAVRSHIVDGPNTYDTEASFFESDDRVVEFWTITTTMRIPQRVIHGTNTTPETVTQNWRQTGLRNADGMEVQQETPTSIKKLPWKIPPYPYMSQVNMYILPALLPHDKPTELAFYSFHQTSHKLSLRTLRIEPLPGGSYRVFDRPTPDRTEQVATFSPTGRLIERRMTDGRTYLATTPQELRRIWGGL